MQSQRPPARSSSLGVMVLPAAALLSGAGLAWEIDLTRFASAVLSYHYAFVAISLAVSRPGLGAALVYPLSAERGRRLPAPRPVGATRAVPPPPALTPP